MSEFDITISDVQIEFQGYSNRVPLKFGHEVTVRGETVRVFMTVTGQNGTSARGCGETPVAVAWSWPSSLPQNVRARRMKQFCELLLEAWRNEHTCGHPMEIGHHFNCGALNDCLADANKSDSAQEPMPYLAALVCCSAFDLALYDAYGILNKVKVFDTFNETYMNHDLTYYYTGGSKEEFAGEYPESYFVPRGEVPSKIAACHLVGGKDPLSPEDLRGDEPSDEYPVLLRDWIEKDGLFNLKIKLTGNDEQWDYSRIVKVGEIALETNVENITADFNCTVEDPAYVCRILERLKDEHAEIYERILYLEQPFPYELDRYPIDVHAVSARKLLLMDESAHDWHFVERGFALGWTGVALKTCKTLTGAILSLCWARKHDMAIMVQDLTNPKLAIIPHVLLAANAGTIMGVEVNSMQFCPDASAQEARIHRGLYRRRNGMIDLSSLGDTGFGYRLEEIEQCKRADAEE